MLVQQRCYLAAKYISQKYRLFKTANKRLSKQVVYSVVKSKFVFVNTTNARKEFEVRLYSFWTSIVNEDELSASSPGHLKPGERTPVPIE
jgi:hypothetical protein